MSNLLVNAFEALEDREPRAQRVAIAVTEASERPETQICIRDNGPGISPELRERIFYPFFTTKERGSGVGCGR